MSVSADITPADLVGVSEAKLKFLEESFPHLKSVILTFRTDKVALEAAQAAEAEARAEAVRKNGAVICGVQYSYFELLQLATIRKVAGKWYDLPEDNAVDRIHAQMRAEVSAALQGVQSTEANRLKVAIATEMASLAK